MLVNYLLTQLLVFSLSPADAENETFHSLSALDETPQGQISKRPRYFPDAASDLSGDILSLYPGDESEAIPEPLQRFINIVFKNCLSRQARRNILKEYPNFDLQVLETPEADKDIVSILGKDFPTREDRVLRSVQTAILCSAVPVLSLVSDLVSQGFTGAPEELIPVSEVLKVSKQSLALTGNAANLVSMKRRSGVVTAVKPKRPKLASFLEEVCNEKIDEPSKELFGPVVKKKLADRAATIKSFNESLSDLDGKSSRRFLGRGSSVKYGGSSSSHRPQRPYTSKPQRPYTPKQPSVYQKRQWNQKPKPAPKK